MSYATKLGSNVNLLVGGNYYLNLTPSPATPSTVELFALVSSQVAENLTVGGRLFYTLNGIGVTNTSSLALRAYAIYSAVSNDRLFVDITPKLDVGLVGGFYLDFNVDIDAGYSISDKFAVLFGAYTGLGIAPAFGWKGLGVYGEFDFFATEMLTLFAGTSFGVDSSFFWDGAYAGLRYDLSSSFALRLTATYTGGGALVLNLTGLYNR
ncbi:MAG: hypothetical protein ACK41E_00675 [Deinococcales bacterium]